jgi:hypothetical protein
MSWASWTTPGVYTGRGGVLTDEVGPVTGDVTVHTTWAEGEARVAVQYSGASDWFTMSGSPVPCAVEAVREGNAATVPSLSRPPA